MALKFDTNIWRSVKKILDLKSPSFALWIYFQNHFLKQFPNTLKKKVSNVSDLKKLVFDEKMVSPLQTAIYSLK